MEGQPLGSVNPSPELVKQVAREMQEILNAPPIAYGVSISTCHFCGRILQNEEAEHVETIGEHRRYRGGCCGGNANRVTQQVRKLGQ